MLRQKLSVFWGFSGGVLFSEAPKGVSKPWEMHKSAQVNTQQSQKDMNKVLQYRNVETSEHEQRKIRKKKQKKHMDSSVTLCFFKKKNLINSAM